MEVRWNFTEFIDYIDGLGHPLGGEGLLKSMRAKMKDILKAVMAKMKGSLSPQPGCFALLGVDFLLDEDERLWLLEFTKNPALRCNTPWLTGLHSALVQGIVDIALEVKEGRAEGNDMASVGETTSFARIPGL